MIAFKQPVALVSLWAKRQLLDENANLWLDACKGAG